MIEHVQHHLTLDDGSRRCHITGEVRQGPKVGICYQQNNGKKWVITKLWRTENGELNWDLERVDAQSQASI